jgi:hypothetical protein
MQVRIFFVMLNVVMLSVIMLDGVMMIVIIVSVVATLINYFNNVKFFCP